MSTRKNTVEKAGTTPFRPLCRFWIHTCTWFTLLTLLFLLLQYLPGTNNVDFVLIPYRFLLLFPFSVVMGGLATLTLTQMKRLPYLLLHFVSFLVNFYLFLILPAGKENTGANRFLVIVTVAAVYWLLRLCIFGFIRLTRKKTDEITGYRDLYR